MHDGVHNINCNSTSRALIAYSWNHTVRKVSNPLRCIGHCAVSFYPQLLLNFKLRCDPAHARSRLSRQLCYAQSALHECIKLCSGHVFIPSDVLSDLHSIAPIRRMCG
jgi:hypothetical protein